MKKKNHKNRLFLLLIPMMFLLSGCAPISTENGGLWNGLVLFLAKGIVFLGETFGSNVGMGIILMTIIIRVLLIPLYAKQIKSQEQMKVIQPKINALNKKYLNKKSTEDQQKKMMEQQAIYKEAGINPLAGCLPLLIQLPLLIAFYNAISYLIPSQAIIKSLGDKTVYGLQELGASSLSSNLFGFNLGDPVVLFALLSGITTFLVSYVSQLGTDMENNPAAGTLKAMMFVMPVMIFFMGLTLPGALSIYWVIGNIISIFQTLYFTRSSIQTERQKRKMTK